MKFYKILKCYASILFLLVACTCIPMDEKTKGKIKKVAKYIGRGLLKATINSLVEDIRNAIYGYTKEDGKEKLTLLLRRPPDTSDQLRAIVRSGDLEKLKIFLATDEFLSDYGFCESYLHIIALGEASKEGHLNIVKFLSEGLQQYQLEKTYLGLTPVQWAALNDHIEIVKHLTEKTMFILESKDEFDNTPFLLAASNGSIKTIRYFLTKDFDLYCAYHGIDIKNVQNQLGKTALHFAAENDHKEVVEELVKAGLEINAKDNAGYTPLDFAKNNEIYNYLKNNGATSGGWSCVIL